MGLPVLGTEQGDPCLSLKAVWEAETSKQFPMLVQCLQAEYRCSQHLC